MTSPSTEIGAAPGRPMKMSLLRNELRWALPLAALGTFILLAAQMSEGWGGAWLSFDDEWPLVTVTFFAFAAPVVALVTALADELTRTREYLLHRPVSARRLFWTRQLVGLGVLAAMMVLAPPLHLGICHLFGLGTELIEHGLILERIAHGFPAFGLYAVTVFALTCARSLWGGGLLAIAAVIVGGSLVAAAILMPGPGVTVSLICLLATPLLIEGAFRCQLQGRDPDRPWNRKRLTIAGPLLLLVSGLIGAASLTLLHFASASALYDFYPEVGLRDGRCMLTEWSRDDRAWYEVDRRHERMGPGMPDDFPIVFNVGSGPWDRLAGGYQEFDSFPRYGKWVGGHLVSKVYGGGRWRHAFYSSDGYLHVYREAGRGSERLHRGWTRKVGKGPEARPFSARAEVISSYNDRLALVHDPADGALWMYDLQSDAPAFERRALPGGDRIRSVENARRLTTTFYPGGVVRLVHGEKGSHFLEGTEWKPVPPDVAAAAAKNPWLEPRMDFDRAGRFSVTLERLDTGAPVFSHRFEPHTLGQKALNLATEAPTLLRSPLTTVGSLFRSQKQAYVAGPGLLLDPAVSLGSRATVVGNVLVCLVLGGLCFLRLRRLGLGGGRRAFWTAAVVLGGLPAYLCYRLVETDRAWKAVPQTVPVKPAPARLLIA